MCVCVYECVSERGSRESEREVEREKSFLVEFNLALASSPARSTSYFHPIFEAS